MNRAESQTKADDACPCCGWHTMRVMFTDVHQCDTCGAIFSAHSWEQAAWEHFTPRVVVVLEGGMVSGILSDRPIRARVIDYDVEGAESEKLVDVPQGEGCVHSSTKARCMSEHSQLLPDRVHELWALHPAANKDSNSNE